MLKKTGVVLLAFILFIIGVAGLVLPVIPGLLFIALAILVLATHFESVERKLETLYRRFPALKHKIEKLRRQHEEKKN